MWPKVVGLALFVSLVGVFGSRSHGRALLASVACDVCSPPPCSGYCRGNDPPTCNAGETFCKFDSCNGEASCAAGCAPGSGGAGCTTPPECAAVTFTYSNPPGGPYTVAWTAQEGYTVSTVVAKGGNGYNYDIFALDGATSGTIELPSNCGQNNNPCGLSHLSLCIGIDDGGPGGGGTCPADCPEPPALELQQPAGAGPYSCTYPDTVAQDLLPKVTGTCVTAADVTSTVTFVPGASAYCGTGTIVYTVQDKCGAKATATQTFTVQPDNTPSISVVSPTYPCFSNVPNTIAGLPKPTTNKVCGLSLTVTKTAFTRPTACGPGGATTVTYTATDPTGCDTTPATAVQTITVTDAEPPVINAPVTLPDRQCTPIAAPTRPAAADNCGAPALSYEQTGPAGFCNAPVTVVWTATDACGNSASLSQTYTVQPAPLTFKYVPGAVNQKCPQDVVLGTAIANKVCGVAPTVTSALSAPLAQCNYEGINVWTATGPCPGQVITANQNVVVNDNVPPVLSGLPPNTVPGYCSPGEVPPPPPVTATDNCDGATTVTFTETFVPAAGCPDAGTVARTWSATDLCGNTATRTRRAPVCACGTAIAGPPAGVTAGFKPLNTLPGIPADQWGWQVTMPQCSPTPVVAEMWLSNNGGNGGCSAGRVSIKRACKCCKKLFSKKSRTKAVANTVTVTFAPSGAGSSIDTASVNLLAVCGSDVASAAFGAAPYVKKTTFRLSCPCDTPVYVVVQGSAKACPLLPAP